MASRVACLAAMAALAVSSCRHQGASAQPDTMKVPGVVVSPSDVRFAVDQLDRSKRPCEDLGGYVNDEWLAAHPVPPDRTSWGVFEMLDERSQVACRQIAEEAADDEHATSIAKLIGDFYASGMDTKAVEEAGVTP